MLEKKKQTSIDIVMLDEIQEDSAEKTSESSFDLFEVDGYLVSMDDVVK